MYKTEETVVVSLGPAMQLNTLAVGFLTGTLLHLFSNPLGGKPHQKKKKRVCPDGAQQATRPKKMLFFGVMGLDHNQVKDELTAPLFMFVYMYTCTAHGL